MLCCSTSQGEDIMLFFLSFFQEPVVLGYDSLLENRNESDNLEGAGANSWNNKSPVISIMKMSNFFQDKFGGGVQFTLLAIVVALLANWECLN